MKKTNIKDSWKTPLGILAAIGAGVLWGLVFVAPQALPSFSPIEIAYGRFFFFGIFSLLHLRRTKAMVMGFSKQDMLMVFCLSAAGFWLYTIGLVWSVQVNRGILTTLVIGLLPITIPLAHKGFSGLRRSFIAGLVLVFFGLCVLELIPETTGPFFPPPLSVSGLVTLGACLCMWTWYGIKNNAFLKARPWISKRDFTSLTGIISLACLSGLAIGLVDFRHVIQSPDLKNYILWSAAIGLGSTWLAYLLWNVCSSFCPPQISGPLIVIETICGTLFTFMYQQRWPEANEIMAILLFTVGAFLAVGSAVKAEKKL